MTNLIYPKGLLVTDWFVFKTDNDYLWTNIIICLLVVFLVKLWALILTIRCGIGSSCYFFSHKLCIAEANPIKVSTLYLLPYTATITMYFKAWFRLTLILLCLTNICFRCVPQQQQYIKMYTVTPKLSASTSFHIQESYLCCSHISVEGKGWTWFAIIESQQLLFSWYISQITKLCTTSLAQIVSFLTNLVMICTIIHSHLSE